MLPASTPQPLAPHQHVASKLLQQRRETCTSGTMLLAADTNCSPRLRMLETSLP